MPPGAVVTHRPRRNSPKSDNKFRGIEMISAFPYYQPPTEPDWFLKIPKPKFNIGDKVGFRFPVVGHEDLPFDPTNNEAHGYVVGISYANIHKAGELCALGWIYLVYHSYIPELDWDEANCHPSVLRSKSGRLFQHQGFNLELVE